MKLLIVGCGRVGSAIAEQMAHEHHQVSVIDEDPEALQRLSPGWQGSFAVGHGLDIEVLEEGGIETADAVVVATDGDNTNIVLAQVAQQRYGCPCVVTRVLDPARAALYADLGLRTVCPTSGAIDVMIQAVCATPGRAQASA